ncbi:cyclase family protein [Clostridium weizhouense]|uniref:Cyclase family protein n=1 Tax=Clostridium weizhouense TaxID=2859781 RepID=A0ABS7APM6_9CLOT|nr:cyclase family protein [Clostridium weizhouense]MBW6410620.1 cyclase family protein [Clostridium weizhouense]
MKIIDLTHNISNNMPVFLKDEKPNLKQVNNVQDDGFSQTLLNIYSHNGTHMDAPLHVIENALTLDKMDVSNFMGLGIVIDCKDLVNAKEKIIDISYIEKNRINVEKAEFLIFNTGYFHKWGNKDYFKDYPILHENLINYIINHKKKGIGIDLMSIDIISSENLPIHNKILKNNIVIIENLTNLDRLGNDLFEFYALPLKYENSDGAPVRAIGIIR